MPELKLVISDPKTGKSYAKSSELDLSGRKIGETITDNDFGLSGFEFLITGGSDNAGFPMRKDIPGAVRKSALLGSGPGIKIKKSGMKLRKTVRGNTFGNLTAQVNLKITKYGKDTIEKSLGIEPKPEETPKTEAQETKEERAPEVKSEDAIKTEN